MKKLLSLIIALMLATVALTAIASPVADDSSASDENEEIFILSGFVTDVQPDHIILRAEGMDYQVNMNEETVLDGFESLAIGDWAQVIHDGKMTRSIPPQVMAMMIRSYSFSGVVSNLAENSFTLTTEDGQEIVVNFDAERFTGVQDTMQVTVFFDGMMTMSIPAQISAEHIRTQEMTGVIVEVLENGFMLDDAGMPTIVHLSDDTMAFTAIEVGASVRVTTTGTMTMSIPAQVTAVEVLPALTVDAVEAVEAIEDAETDSVEITEESTEDASIEG